MHVSNLIVLLTIDAKGESGLMEKTVRGESMELGERGGL
jgi:hypothetical protein